MGEAGGYIVTEILIFIVGTIVGAGLGMFVMGLMAMAARDDECSRCLTSTRPRDWGLTNHGYREDN